MKIHHWLQKRYVIEPCLSPKIEEKHNPRKDVNDRTEAIKKKISDYVQKLRNTYLSPGLKISITPFLVSVDIRQIDAQQQPFTVVPQTHNYKPDHSHLLYVTTRQVMDSNLCSYYISQMPEVRRSGEILEIVPEYLPTLKTQPDT